MVIRRKKVLVSIERSALKEQLKRLVDSGLCPVGDADEYLTNLRELTEDIVRARETIRRTTRVFKALSHPTRLKILRLLSVRDMCVCEIMAILNTTQPTTSHHLNLLENMRLIEERREGKWVFYSVADSKPLQNMIEDTFRKGRLPSTGIRKEQG